MVDLTRAPLVALSSGTKELISNLLNPKRYFHTKNGLVRDWRGLAYICDIDPKSWQNIDNSTDPTGRVLAIVESKAKDFTLQNLRDAFETIERWDVVDDTHELFEKDAELYLEKLQKSKDTAEEQNNEIDSDILTIDDLFRMEQGQKTQHYDAFILYAEEDTDFANEVVDNLENKNHMKLCVKERDLIAGVSFEHEAIMRLILERCNRLILIISPEFFASPANKFFMNFAQAASIDKQQERKIIPCVYKICEFPPQLRYLSKIYYSQNLPENFWRKLVCSTKVVSNTKGQNSKSKSKSSSDYFIKKVPELEPKKKLKCKIPIEENKIEDPAKIVEENDSEMIPNLPSLDGLSSLEAITNDECTQKKTKKKKRFIGKNFFPKKLQAFLVKS